MLKSSILSWKGILAALVTSLVGAACATAATPTDAPPKELDLPDTSGQAVWAYLQGVNYRENWELWPGKGELYEGSEPHGMLLTTYLSADALSALNSREGAMPEGAIIVKENYMPDGTLAATTVMYKVSGYDAEHNDWFFTKIRADNFVEAEGRVEGCQTCHGSKKDNDYIFTGELK